MTSFFFSRDMCGGALARTLNILFAFLQRPLTWVSKLSLLSVLTPNNFLQVLLFIRDSTTRISIGSSVLTIKWHLSVFLLFDYERTIETIFLLILVKMRLPLNAITRIIYSIIINIARKISVTNPRNKSLRKRLNKIDPSIEPWGTSKSMSSNELYAWLTSVHCFLWER